MEEKAQIIQAFYRNHKRMPTYSEICEIFNYKSKNAASKLVTKLARYGVLEKDKKGRLIPTFSPYSIRLLGLVEAGFPAPVEEQEIDTMSLDEWLIDDKEASYMLKVKGPSMIDAGIVDGDYVLVERTRNVKPGDIVIADVDGSFTLKYLRHNKQTDTYYLEAANEDYDDIYPEGALNVEARVISVIRRYKNR